MKRKQPDRRTLMVGALAGSASFAAPAIAAGVRRLRMVTSWPKNLPGPGVSAERLARRLNAVSGGRLDVVIYAAGELVPPLSVFDAVADGAAEMAHTASFFWQGKMPAAAFFTAVPFGLMANEHAAWIYFGGGQALWNQLYSSFGVKPFMAGNTGMQMGGWYNREIRSGDDLKGLKIRMPGLGGEIMRRLGATPVSLAPGEIGPALGRGTIDAAEFLGPWSDFGLGLNKVARYYYWPGFHEPNGTGEALISAAVWSDLDPQLRRAVETACAAEDAFSRAESDWHNARVLKRLVESENVALRAFPAPVLAAARDAATAVLGRFEAEGGIAADIFRSYSAMRDVAMPWADVAAVPFLASRRAPRSQTGE